MHGWSRVSCDQSFRNDMTTACKNANIQSRKRRHIEDYIPLLRHKLKRSLKVQEADDSLLFMWGTVCEMAAGKQLQYLNLLLWTQLFADTVNVFSRVQVR